MTPDHPNDQADQQPERQPTPSGSGLATASLVLGLLSICFGPITGIVGGILGWNGLKRPNGKGMAAVGLGLSLLFSAGWIALGVYIYFDEKEFQKGTFNYRGVGLALHGTSSGTLGSLPMPYHHRPGEFGFRASREDIDTPRQPIPTDVSDRLGWRVYLLPYLFQHDLHRKFRTVEPWNSASNLPLSQYVIPEFADRDTPQDPTTRIRCFYDNGAYFDAKRRGKIDLTSENRKADSETILLVEGGEKVTWTRFQEYRFDPNGPLPPLGRTNANGFRAVMGDASVRWFRKDTDPEVLKALIVQKYEPVRTWDEK